MNSSKSFRFWLDQGKTREELTKFYAMTPGQYDKVINCLEQIKQGKAGGET